MTDKESVYMAEGIVYSAAALKYQQYCYIDIIVSSLVHGI